MECKNAVEVKTNEAGERICLCSVTDRWENITHGDCFGNCPIQEEEKKKPGRKKKE